MCSPKPVIMFHNFYELPKENAEPVTVFVPESYPAFPEFVAFAKTFKSQHGPHDHLHQFVQNIVHKPQPIIPMGTDAERQLAAKNRQAEAEAAFNIFDIAFQSAKNAPAPPNPPSNALKSELELMFTLFSLYFNGDGMKRKTLVDAYFINHPEYLFVYYIHTVVSPSINQPYTDMEVNIRNHQLLKSRFPRLDCQTALGGVMGGPLDHKQFNKVYFTDKRVDAAVDVYFRRDR